MLGNNPTMLNRVPPGVNTSSYWYYMVLLWHTYNTFDPRRLWGVARQLPCEFLKNKRQAQVVMIHERVWARDLVDDGYCWHFVGVVEDEHIYYIITKCNEFYFKVWEVKRLMGLTIHQDVVKPASSSEWRSVVTFVKSVRGLREKPIERTTETFVLILHSQVMIGAYM